MSIANEGQLQVEPQHESQAELLKEADDSRTEAGMALEKFTPLLESRTIERALMFEPVHRAKCG